MVWPPEAAAPRGAISLHRTVRCDEEGLTADEGMESAAGSPREHESGLTRQMPPKYR